MKKSLQLILLFTALLFTFSCSKTGQVIDPDPGSALTQTWAVRSISAFDDVECTNSLFAYAGAYQGQMGATEALDCQNMEWFFSGTDDKDVVAGDATAAFTADDFCASTDALGVNMYFELTSTDTLSEEAAGTYTKTMYGEQADGRNHSAEYSTYGRYYTYGTNMITQILAKIVTDDGNGNDRVIEANEGAEDEVHWTYKSTETTLEMSWEDDAGVDEDLNPSCVVVSYQLATDYELRGCTDAAAANYFGGDNNVFSITASRETGNCKYSVDEAKQPCVKISHDDLDDDGMFEADELITYSGIIDCNGGCQYEAGSAWIGDGVCDGTNGNRGDGEYNCEAFDWDGWDCACAKDCLATYDIDTGTVNSIDNNEPTMIGEGNGLGVAYITTNCQSVCNVEECGYDIRDLTDTTTWDCCPESCLNTADAATSCDTACNIGACNWYKNENTDGGTCDDGVSMTKSDCDAALGIWTTNNIGLCCAPGLDASGDPIDCAAVAGDGSCDEACNNGACNKDGGDCE